MGQSINQRMDLRMTVSGIPVDFAGTDDIIINLAEERKCGIEIIERTS